MKKLSPTTKFALQLGAILLATMGFAWLLSEWKWRQTAKINELYGSTEQLLRRDVYGREEAWNATSFCYEIRNIGTSTDLLSVSFPEFSCYDFLCEGEMVSLENCLADLADSDEIPVLAMAKLATVTESAIAEGEEDMKERALILHVHVTEELDRQFDGEWQDFREIMSQRRP